MTQAPLCGYAPGIRGVMPVYFSLQRLCRMSIMGQRTTSARHSTRKSALSEISAGERAMLPGRERKGPVEAVGSVGLVWLVAPAKLSYICAGCACNRPLSIPLRALEMICRSCQFARRLWRHRQPQSLPDRNHLELYFDLYSRYGIRETDSHCSVLSMVRAVCGWPAADADGLRSSRQNRSNHRLSFSNPRGVK
jgi:hypothetical protein